VIAGWAVFGFAFGLMLSVSVPQLLGMRSFTVLTGSMRPMIEPGDMVVDEQVSPEKIRVGDIVTFREPDGKRLITHRVRTVEVGEGKAQISTRGDANDTSERWQAKLNGKVGRVAYKVPKIGYAVEMTRTRRGRLGLISIPAFLLAIFELIRLWRPSHREAAGVA
jgi:signal peptidase